MVHRFIISIIFLMFSSCATMHQEELNLIKNSYGNIQYWDSQVFPLLILVPDSVSNIIYNKLLQAAEEINIAANCIVFDVVRRSDLELVFSGFYRYYEYGRIVFKVQEIPINRLAETETFLQLGEAGNLGQVKAVEIRVSPSYSMVGIDKVIKHELLHALQLDHDLNIDSIMLEAVHDSKYKIEQVDINYVHSICSGLMSFSPLTPMSNVIQ